MKSKQTRSYVELAEDNVKLKQASKLLLGLVLLLSISVIFNYLEVKNLSEIESGEYISAEACESLIGRSNQFGDFNSIQASGEVSADSEGVRAYILS